MITIIFKIIICNLIEKIFCIRELASLHISCTKPLISKLLKFVTKPHQSPPTGIHPRC